MISRRSGSARRQRSICSWMISRGVATGVVLGEAIGQRDGRQPRQLAQGVRALDQRDLGFATGGEAPRLEPKERLFRRIAACHEPFSPIDWRPS